MHCSLTMLRPGVGGTMGTGFSTYQYCSVAESITGFVSAFCSGCSTHLIFNACCLSGLPPLSSPSVRGFMVGAHWFTTTLVRGASNRRCLHTHSSSIQHNNVDIRRWPTSQEVSAHTGQQCLGNLLPSILLRMLSAQQALRGPRVWQCPSSLAIYLLRCSCFSLFHTHWWR